MRRWLLLALSGVLSSGVARPLLAQDGLQMRIDSSRRTVTLRTGPFDLPAEPEDEIARGMGEHLPAVPLLRFTWPVDGWVRGLKLRVFDVEGHPLPRELVDYVMVVNFGRRELFYSRAERLIATGRETGDVRLPATIGIPVSAVTPMALLLAWHNPGRVSVGGAAVEASIDWTAHNVAPRPVSVLPVTLNVVDPVGRAGDFDLPDGPSTWTADFTLPLSGRILVAGAHLHDYGSGFELQEIGAGGARSIFRLGTRLSPAGELLGVDRIVPGAAGNGIKLTKGRCYRLIAGYDNPTGRTIVKGAMANLILLFAPDEIGSWPPLVPGDPGYRKDLKYLESAGRGGGRSPEHPPP